MPLGQQHYSSSQAKHPKSLQRTMWEVNVPNASSSSHGTATGEVRHYHNCGSRTFYIGLYRASHKSGIQWTSSEHPRRTFIQAPVQSIFKILMQGHLEDFQQDPHKIFSRTCTRSCKGTYRVSPGPLQELLTGPAQDHAKVWQNFTRISTRSFHKDL